VKRDIPALTKGFGTHNPLEPVKALSGCGAGGGGGVYSYNVH